MQVVETTSLSRKERERQARRQAMLDAAQSVFAEKGFGLTSIDEIASRAEFGKGTIYNYFPGGKEEILFALLDQLYDGLIEVTEKHFDPDNDGKTNFREQFRSFLVGTFTFLEQRDSLFLIALKEAHRHLLGDDPEKSAYFHRKRNALVGALARPIEAAMQRGEIKPLPTEAVTHMLLGNINGCYTHVCLCNRFGNGQKSAVGADENAEFITTMLFDGLLTGN